MVINLLTAAKVSLLTSESGQPTGASRTKKKKKNLQNLTRHLPVKCGENMHVRGEKKMRLPTYLPPPLLRLQLRPRICARRRWKDARMLRFSFFFSLLPLPPSSCLFLATPPRNLKRDLTTLAQHLGDAGNMSGSARSRSHSTHVGNHRPPLGPPKTCGHFRPRRAIALRIFLIYSGGGKKMCIPSNICEKKERKLN